jgi:glucan phosphoethanolaminetransferase (alkaline phosphatase superfamily)
MSEANMLESFLTIRAVPFGAMEIKILSIVFLLAFVASTVFRFAGVKSKTLFKKRFSRFSNFCLVLGIVGLVFLFFNYEKAALLGSKIWFPILGILFLVWLGFILYDIFVRLPREKKAISEKEKFEKYLP